MNESFSDVMAVGAEFYLVASGRSTRPADYILGEDVFTPAAPGALTGTRSRRIRLSYGYPDHYAVRYRGPEDGGGVHINSSISNHAYYLAIEGGTNRTSRAGRAGRRRGQPRADRARVLSRVHRVPDAQRRTSHRPGRPRCGPRRSSTAIRARRSAPSVRPGRPWGSIDRVAFLFLSSPGAVHADHRFRHRLCRPRPGRAGRRPGARHEPRRRA